MNRPSVLQVGGTLYWVILTRNPDTMVLKDADSTPTVAVRKNGASTADSVTITKRSATTGIYDCSYNPASEVEGDKFTFEESATVTGTTTSSATYRHNWDLTVVAVERGTDGANTTTPPTTGAIADAVWDEPYAGHTTAGTFGKLADILRKANLTIEGTVSSAITPTTLTFSSNVSATTSAYAHAVLLFISGPLTGENSPIISYNNTNGVFVLEEPLTAAPSDGDEFVVIAGSHVHAIADIQSGLATTANINEIKGAGWSSATDTLEEIRDAVDAGGGGGSTVIVSPLSALAPERVNGTTISVAVGDVTPITIDVYDASDAAVNLSTQGNLEVCIESRDNVDLQVVANANITISGTDSNKATWTPNAAAVGTVDKHRWSLRTASAKKVLAYGPWVVERVALNDA